MSSPQTLIDHDDALAGCETNAIQTDIASKHTKFVIEFAFRSVQINGKTI